MRSKSTFVNGFFIVLGGISIFILNRTLISIFTAAKITNTPILGDNFMLSTLLAVVLGAVVGFIAFKNPRLSRTVNESVDEMFKINWPSFEESKRNTMIVVATSVVASIILGAFDLTFSWLSRNNMFLR